MSIKIAYSGKLETPDIIKDLFYFMPQKEVELLTDDISPTLYEFTVHYQHT